MKEDFNDLSWVQKALRDAQRHSDTTRMLQIARGVLSVSLAEARFRIDEREGTVEASDLERAKEKVRMVAPVEISLHWSLKRAMSWAFDCAERVLEYYTTDFPDDPRPAQALTVGRGWLAGQKDDAQRRQAYDGVYEAMCEANDECPGSDAMFASQALVYAFEEDTFNSALSSLCPVKDSRTAEERAWQLQRQIAYLTSEDEIPK